MLVGTRLARESVIGEAVCLIRLCLINSGLLEPCFAREQTGTVKYRLEIYFTIIKAFRQPGGRKDTWIEVRFTKVEMLSSKSQLS